MRLAVLIWFLGVCPLSWGANYRLNCDQYVSNALCQAISNYLDNYKPDHAKIALRELAEKIQTRFTSLQKVSLTKSWDGKIDIQVNSVQPVYIIDLKNSDRVFVLAQSNFDTRIVPALWFNPVCLENLPTVCLNSKNLNLWISKNNLQKTSSSNKTKFKNNTTEPRSDYGVISRQDLNLIKQISGEFEKFLLALDPQISANYLIEWVNRNQIILHYCKLAQDYSCKIVVRVNNPDNQQILTPEFLTKCLKLLPAELFEKAGTDAISGNFKINKSKLKNFTIDLRFNKQVVILND